MKFCSENINITKRISQLNWNFYVKKIEIIWMLNLEENNVYDLQAETKKIQIKQQSNIKQ